MRTVSMVPRRSLSLFLCLCVHAHSVLGCLALTHNVGVFVWVLAGGVKPASRARSGAPQLACGCCGFVSFLFLFSLAPFGLRVPCLHVFLIGDCGLSGARRFLRVPCASCPRGAVSWLAGLVYLFVVSRTLHVALFFIRAFRVYIGRFCSALRAQRTAHGVLCPRACVRLPHSWHPAAVIAWHLVFCRVCGQRRASPVCLMAVGSCAMPLEVAALLVRLSAFQLPCYFLQRCALHPLPYRVVACGT